MAETKQSVQGGDNELAGGKRRSRRVQIAMAVLVRGKNGSVSIEERTQTVSVNAHGGMVRLAAQIVRGQSLSLVNSRTAEELPCTVTFLGQTEEGKTEVGFEFSEPSPLFWGITFPPEDWNSSPDRKRPSSSPQPPLPAPKKK